MSSIDLLEENLLKLFDKEESINIDDINSKTYGTRSKFKCGVYFLYDTNKDKIYIGKIGNYKFTSLYSRVYGHGSGAHKNKDWFDKVVTCKFVRLEKLDKKSLLKIERLLIFKLKPIYNDNLIQEDEAKQLLELI